MNEIIDRARVVLTAAVTWITAASLVVQFAITQEPLASIPEVAQYGAHALAFLANVVLIIRRVTPVPGWDRGVV